MSAENEVYAEGTRILKDLNQLRKEIMALDASDTACKQQVLELVEESRERFREALSILSGLV